MYRIEYGEWPPDGGRGNTPSALQEYFAENDNPFGKISPFGGVYDWNNHSGGTKLELLIVGGSWTDEEKRAIDSILDDGDLSEGSVRGAPIGMSYNYY